MAIFLFLEDLQTTCFLGIHHDTPSKFLAGFPVATHDPQISVKSVKLQSRVYQTFLRNSHVFTSNLPPSAVEHQGTPDP